MDKNLNDTQINTEPPQEKEEFVEVKTREINSSFYLCLLYTSDAADEL